MPLPIAFPRPVNPATGDPLKRLPILAVALSLLVSVSSADAGCGLLGKLFHGRAARASACSTTTATVRYAYRESGAIYVSPQAPIGVMPVPLSTLEPDGPSAFLALLNSARAQVGRPALAWDATLAAYAASNAATHMPGSSGGAAQCWAGSRSYVQAFHQWRSSPAHWAILVNATTSVGVAPCPTGITLNAR